MGRYHEKALDVLQHEDAAVRKVRLLRHFRAAPGHRLLRKVALLLQLVLELARKVVPEGGHDFGVAAAA